MKINLKPVHEQVVVVFGASSGIGRETALQFARRGARVVVAARNGDGLDSLVNLITQAGGVASAQTADATDFEQVRRVADLAVERYGHLDTWVHAAAVSLYADFDQTTPQEFRRVVDVNLTGQAYGAMAALPHLKREGRGALIHISSVEARRSFPYQSAYSASKHGVDGFVESLRMELEHEGYPIAVTNIMPGSINTPLFDKALTKLGVLPKGVPPIYEPDLVAEAILYAAEHPVRDMVVGGSTKMLIMNQRMSRRMSDAMVKSVGFSAQKTDVPKAAEAPNNLFQPIQGFNRVHGSFGDEVKPFSAYTWLERHPAVGAALSLLPVAVLAATATVLVARSVMRPSLPLRKKRWVEVGNDELRLSWQPATEFVGKQWNSVQKGDLQKKMTKAVAKGKQRISDRAQDAYERVSDRAQDAYERGRDAYARGRGNVNTLRTRAMGLRILGAGLPIIASLGVRKLNERKQAARSQSARSRSARVPGNAGACE